MVWFGIRTGLWEHDGQPPLWLDCGNECWLPVPIVLEDEVVEYADVLDAVMSTLRELAESPDNRR